MPHAEFIRAIASSRSFGLRSQGMSAHQVVRAKVSLRISDETRSGWVAANMQAIGPPSSWEKTATRSEPTASSTAMTSSICSSSVGSPSSGSDSPEPRRSKTITRANSEMRSKNAAIFGCSQNSSKTDIQVGT